MRRYEMRGNRNLSARSPKSPGLTHLKRKMGDARELLATSGETCNLSELPGNESGNERRNFPMSYSK